MSAAHRRELASQAVASRQCSQRQACRFFRLHRSTYRYRPKYPSLRRQQADQSVVDEYTREVHALHVDRHIGAKRVRQVMEELIQQHGAPAYIRSDNGPEFIATLLKDWLEQQRIKTLFIEPGSPWQNGYLEPSGARWAGAGGDGLRRSATGGEHQSFHDKFRRECLGRNVFYSLSESRVVIGDWRQKFNQIRPHRSLGMRTPREFASNLPPPKRSRVASSPGSGD